MSSTSENPRLDWMNTGGEWVPESDRPRFLEAIKELKWFEPYEGQKLPMLPAMGIQGFIEQCGVPKVDQIALGSGYDSAVEKGACYGLFAVQGNYKNARVRAYVLDGGDVVRCVVAEVFAK